MVRFFAVLLCPPTVALAGRSPLPRAFAFDAAFAGCTVDLARVDLEQCAATLRDEGVVPLNDVTCTAHDPECTDKNEIHAALCYRAVHDLSDTVNSRTDENWGRCIEQTIIEDALLDCHTAGLVEIRADLAQQEYRDK